MLTHEKTETTTVHTCDICKETYTDETVAKACEASHATCLHPTWAYTTVTGTAIIQRACLKCQYTQVKSIPMGMDLWPLLKD